MEEGSGRQRCLKMMFLYQDADQLYDKQTRRELPETEIRSDDHCTCPGRCMHAGWTYTSAPMHRTRAFIPILATRRKKRAKKAWMEENILPRRRASSRADLLSSSEKEKKTPSPIGGPFPQELPNATPLHA